MRTFLFRFAISVFISAMSGISVAPSARAQMVAPLQIPAATPRLSNGAWREKLRDHPRLFGPVEELRALSQRKKDAFEEIKNSVGDSIEAAGIAHAVEGLGEEQIAPYLEIARRNVARGATNVHQDSWIWMEQVALTLDFFHAQIPPGERDRMIAWLLLQLASFKDDESGFHNSILPKIHTYWRIYLVIKGENPRAEEFRDYAIRLYEQKVVPILNTFGAGGGNTEAGWYARGSLWHLTRALELARRADGYDGFSKAPKFWYQRLAYELFQPYPGRWIYGAQRFPVEGDGSYLYGAHNEAAAHTRLILEQLFLGSPLSGYSVNARARGSNAPARLVQFLYGEADEKPLSLTNFPLAHLQSGVGNVYARSDWKDDATWFRFSCGDYFSGHQHLDVGNFEIFRREPLATESGEYIDYSSNHSINYLMRTVAHNAILVHQSDEKFPLRGQTFRDGGRVKYANDGGQNKTWEWPVGDLDEWQKKRDQWERGDILAYHNTPQFLYVGADCTRAYSPSKLKSWTRQIVFVRPDVFVICDRVSAVKAEYRKTWLLHSSVEAKLENQTATIAPGKSRLTVQTLLPQNAKFQTVRSPNYGGQNFDEKPSAQSEVAPQWRLEVSPPNANETDVFLHVLSTSDTPIRATLLRETGRVGAQIGGVQVFFNAQNALGGVLKQNGRSTQLETLVRAGLYE